MRILVTGAGGQVGHELVRVCTDAGDEVIACDRRALDLADRDSVYQAVTGTQPDIVLHAGAWTQVDACEGDPDRAFLVNSLGTGWVADACRRIEAHLLYLSTDYVFDGTKSEPYQEWDVPNPLSVYGRSKWAGERAVEANTPGSTIVRTSWVCGAHGANMVRTVLRLADEPELVFVDDQRGAPTFAADLAPMVRRLAVERRPGVHHVTNQGETTRYGFAREVLSLTGRDPDKVRPIRTADLDPPRAASRPACSVLDNASLRLAGLPMLPHHRDALERLLEDLGERR